MELTRGICVGQGKQNKDTHRSETVDELQFHLPLSHY
jgi:hypothetical protein